LKNKWIKRGTATIAVATLVLASTPIVGQLPIASAAAAAEKSLSSQIVKLNSQSTISIRDVQFLMQDKGKVVAFTVTYANNGSSPIDLSDYWLRIKTKSGKSFKAYVKESDKEITSISPKTNQFITYYAVVDNATKLQDLTFQIVKWDFSVTNYERILGTIKASSKETNRVAAFKDKVMVVNNTKVRSAIKQAFVTKDQSNAYVSINYLLENVGLKPANLSNINFFIQTESNSVYKVSASELEQMSLQPNERKITTLTVKLPVSVASKPLALVMAINDEASKVILPVGEFLMPSLNAAPVTAIGQQRSVFLSGQQVVTSIGRASLEDKGNETGISLEYYLVNNGSDSIKVPDLEVYLRTKQNVSYPLTYTKDEGKLLPGIKKTVSLTGDIPTNVKVEDADIVVRTAGTDKDFGYVIGTYKTNSIIQEGSLGSSFALDKYSVQLNAIQRTQLEDNDMLVADLSIKNNDSISRKVPSLSGYFMVNGVKVENEATAVTLDDSITIAPGETYNMVVYSKIPYSTTVSKITFVAVEPEKDKAAKVLYQFSGQQLSSIPVYAKDKAYEIANTGKKASVKLVRNAIFSGTVNNQFYAEFAVENKELRMANLSKLGGYLKDANGQIVPVTFASLKNKVLPNGKVLLSAWAVLPNGFNNKDYSLFIGQSVGASGGSGASGEGAAPSADAIVKLASYKLGANNLADINTSFQNIQLAGYTVSLSKFLTQLKVGGGFNVEGVYTKLNYSLKKDEQYDYIAGDHKLVIEFVNQDSLKAAYSKVFTLGDVAEGSQDEVLKEGTGLPLDVLFNDSEVQSKISDYKQYTINVYDEFQGTRLLVAAKENLNWFMEQ